MTSPGEKALVIGAGSPLGTAVLRHLAAEDGIGIVAADNSAACAFLAEAKPKFGKAAARIEIELFDPETGPLGFRRGMAEELQERATRVFYLSHSRDRSESASQIRYRNQAQKDAVLGLANSAAQLRSLIVLSDVGLIGDYPGRFSEAWLNVGQIPFDEVDRSSLELETDCLRESRLPIVRARVGLLSDLRGVLVRSRSWKSATEVLLPNIGWIRYLPRFLSIPYAVAPEALAPLTPTEWAARALVSLSSNPGAIGKAVHLVADPAPPMEQILRDVTGMAGGARVRGGVPTALLRKLGALPGLRETARRQADHLSAWWTPHRYCLSRNELDTFNARSLLPETLAPPPPEKWVFER